MYEWKVYSECSNCDGNSNPISVTGCFQRPPLGKFGEEPLVAAGGGGGIPPPPVGAERGPGGCGSPICGPDLLCKPLELLTSPEGIKEEVDKGTRYGWLNELVDIGPLELPERIL